MRQQARSTQWLLVIAVSKRMPKNLAVMRQSKVTTLATLQACAISTFTVNSRIRVSHTVPTLLVTKISRTFQNPRSIVPGPCRMPAMFKDKDIQQWVCGEALAASDFLHIQIKSQPIFANFGTCTCIIVSAYHIIA